MRFMCWDMVVEHQNNHCLVDTDYFLRVGANLCCDYIQQVAALWRCSPAPTKMPIAPKHQPYFCGPRVTMPKTPVPPLPATHPTQYLADHPTIAITCGFQNLSTWPIYFGTISHSCSSDQNIHWCLYNLEIMRMAGMLAHFDWVVYGFNSGQFVSAILECGMSFCLALACNPYSNGHALFCSMTPCTNVLDGASLLVDHVWSLGITSNWLFTLFIPTGIPALNPLSVLGTVRVR